MTSDRHVVHLNEDDDDEARRAMHGSGAVNPIRLDLRDDSDIVEAGKSSSSSSFIKFSRS